MNIRKINIYSIVDVITNSSTTIYTYQENSIEPAKELIEEILKLLRDEEEDYSIDPDDYFYFGVFCKNELYFDRFDYKKEREKPDDMPEVKGEYNTKQWKYTNRKREKWLNNLKKDIMKGEKKKPNWMEIVEEEGGYSVLTPDTYLHIIPKEEKYKPLVEKIINFINSPRHEGIRDG